MTKRNDVAILFPILVFYLGLPIISVSLAISGVFLPPPLSWVLRLEAPNCLGQMPRGTLSSVRVPALHAATQPDAAIGSGGW